MNNGLFLTEWKDAVFNEGDLLPVYIHRKGTQEDPCYFDKELPSKNNNSNEEIKDNKIDEENKENIPDNEPLRTLTSNKVVQILLTQEEEKYSWTSNSDKC